MKQNKGRASLLDWLKRWRQNGRILSACHHQCRRKLIHTHSGVQVALILDESNPFKYNRIPQVHLSYKAAQELQCKMNSFYLNKNIVCGLVYARNPFPLHCWLGVTGVKLC